MTVPRACHLSATPRQNRWDNYRRPLGLLLLLGRVCGGAGGVSLRSGNRRKSCLWFWTVQQADGYEGLVFTMATLAHLKIKCNCSP